jgi:lipopolysaccharide export LptBFGC system permease protein LptF
MSRIRFAPFGRHTRYMLAGYLRHVFIVTSILLAIALTIDLWPQYQTVAESGGPSMLAAVWAVVRFSALRTPGLIAPFLPFAAFVGVLWTEVVHTQSGERMLVWNSGRSPAQCLAPAFFLGLLLGASEFAMDAYLGPAAMSLQMQERLGRDGQRLDRSRIGKPAWIAVSGGLLKAEIEYGPPSALHNLTFFKRDTSGRLSEVFMAEVARRQSGTSYWLMHDGQSWKTSDAPISVGNRLLPLPRSGKMVPFTSRPIVLDLDPLWLSYFGMETQYLSLPVLQRLAQINTGTSTAARYETRLQVVYSETLLPGAMALLASSLAMLLLAYGTPVAGVVGIVFCGYLAHFATKACLLLGQNDYMPPVTAGWLVPIGIFGTTVAVFMVIESQRREPNEKPAISAG